MAAAAAPGSALAARCTACSTVFRVVPDQLRVSDGWVRCGRCAQVFNAADNLIDLDTGVPRRLDLGAAVAPTPPRPPERPPAAPPPLAPQPEAHPASSWEATAPLTQAPSPWLISPPQGLAAAVDPISPAAVPAEVTQVTAATVAPAATAATAAMSMADATDAATEPAARPHEPAPAGPPAQPAATAVPDFDLSQLPTEPQPSQYEAMPSFVRQADRAARWRRPRVRAALAAGCVLAGGLLAAQALHQWRDRAAARWPTLQPVLALACAQLGCRLSAPRDLESLSVESSGLLQVAGRRGQYELTVALRNRSALALAVPALELSLTDAQGRLLARRVLLPAELAATTEATVPARSDLALQARLQTAPSSTPGDQTQAVVGYTIELFYP